MSAPVEGKVWAATAGTGAGAIVSTLVLWVLGVTCFGVSTAAESAGQAVAAVPSPVVGAIGLGITVGGTFLGGYLAKHTARPVPTVDPPVAPVAPVVPFVPSTGSSAPVVAKAPNPAPEPAPLTAEVANGAEMSA